MEQGRVLTLEEALADALYTLANAPDYLRLLDVRFGARDQDYGGGYYWFLRMQAEFRGPGESYLPPPETRKHDRLTIIRAFVAFVEGRAAAAADAAVQADPDDPNPD